MSARVKQPVKVRRKDVILCAAFCVAVVGAYAGFRVLVFHPLFESLAKVSVRVQAQRSEINEGRTAACKIHPLMTENAKLREQTQQFLDACVPVSSVQEVIDRLYGAARTAGVQLVSMEKGEEESHDGPVTAIPYTLEVAGAYHAIGRFVNASEEGPFLLNVTGLELKRAERGDGATGRLGLRIWVRKGRTAEAGPPA